MTGKQLRIGTRDSKLAVWQARFVADALRNAGYKVDLHFIKTEGDRVLDTPLPLIGGKGVFTKALDDALLAGEIDLAVHSLKDIPTRYPEELTIAAISRRENPADVLVTKSGLTQRADDRRTLGETLSGNVPLPSFLKDPGYPAVIASSSYRRIGQWLSRYPGHQFTDIRGNIQTRLRKLAESDWDGAIFAASGLIRLGLESHACLGLDWMLPAPGQGALGVMTRDGDSHTIEAVRKVHDPNSALCTAIEREFLHVLQGGCHAPVGALAVADAEKVILRVSVVSPDGTGLIRFSMSRETARADGLGEMAANEALLRGADTLLDELSSGDTENLFLSRAKNHMPHTVITTRPTRPEEVRHAANAGIRLMDYPAWGYRWSRPDPLPWDRWPDKSKTEAWVFTSWRGVEGWWRIWRELTNNCTVKKTDLPVIYAIGKKTAQVVGRLFPDSEVVIPHEGYGLAMGHRMAGDGIGSAIHFCGSARRHELAQVCHKYKMDLTELEVYQRCALTDPKPLQTHFDAILFFSPDGVEAFYQQYEVPPGSWKAVAVGRTTAIAVRRIAGKEPLVAKTATFEDMITLIL